MSALDDLVKSGKLRSVGISYAPAWKVGQAKVMSHFRGWNPLIALQIEYSLPGWGVLVRALSAFQYRENALVVTWLPVCRQLASGPNDDLRPIKEFRNSLVPPCTPPRLK